MKKYLIEFIGAFFLVLTIALTGNPIAIGFVLMVLVYMGGYISGAHYNPAVTLTMFLTGKIGQNEAGKYVIAQILGGLAAAGIFYFCAAIHENTQCRNQYLVVFGREFW